MAKEQASKKKTVKTSNARWKTSPAASKAEPATSEPDQEQLAHTPEITSDATPQEQGTEQHPLKKPKGKRPAKKKKPAGGKKEEEKPEAQAGAAAKLADEQKPKAEEEQKSLPPEAKEAATEAKEVKKAKPKRRPKNKSKKAKEPSAEGAPAVEKVSVVEEPVAEEKAAPAVPAASPKKKSKKKPAKKKPTPPALERKPGVQRIVVASANPAKVKAAELGFSRMFPDKEFSFLGLSVDSGVTDQPMTDDETFAGALNRAMSAREEQPEAEFWIGLEGGLQEEGDDFYAFAWIVILGPDELQGKSRTGTFAIPPAVTELVRNGKELGEADDIVFGQTNSKQSSGAIGILTHGILDRAAYYAEAVLMALIPFKNPALYLLQEEVSEEV